MVKGDEHHFTQVQACKMDRFVSVPNRPYFWLCGAHHYNTESPQLLAEPASVFGDLPPETHPAVKQTKPAFALPLHCI